ncbi:unnamed protein product [Bursaphelenchus xylophilus]|uniref:(pine wood nematode) hypothetical protein n=1 Tax=Bursaphelenchus xylophilus TaxID=6326 RepID=A0A1I7S8Q1_BURXY|nr:unnamed protein product [Bursaphelenchus xylophilus]CAG9089348.1 unnamed protein product [Bursaphelenchus xylophilus]
MKRCNYCNREIASKSGPHCDKCIKNQAKYGAPTTCKYCKLPAAFVDQKCVHCAYSERKNGPPKECPNCRQKAAFKDPAKPGKLCCRPCALKFGKDTSSKHRRHSEHATTSKTSKHSKERSSHSHSTSQHKSFTSNALASIMPVIGKNVNSLTPSTSGITMLGMESPEEKIQQLRERNEELQRQVINLQKQLREKQERVVELEAEKYLRDNEAADKVKEIKGLFDSTVTKLQKQIEQLHKELATKKK